MLNSNREPSKVYLFACSHLNSVTAFLFLKAIAKMCYWVFDFEKFDLLVGSKKFNRCLVLPLHHLSHLLLLLKPQWLVLLLGSVLVGHHTQLRLCLSSVDCMGRVLPHTQTYDLGPSKFSKLSRWNRKSMHQAKSRNGQPQHHYFWSSLGLWGLKILFNLQMSKLTKLLSIEIYRF